MYRLESWGNPQLPIEIEDSIEAKNFKKQENFSVDNTSDVSATKASNGYLIYEANVRVNNIKNGNFRIFMDIYYMIFFNCARVSCSCSSTHPRSNASDTSNRAGFPKNQNNTNLKKINYCI